MASKKHKHKRQQKSDDEAEEKGVNALLLFNEKDQSKDAYQTMRIPALLQLRISESNLMTSMNVLATDRRIKTGLCFLCSFYLSNLAQSLAANTWVSKQAIRDAAWAFLQVHQATIISKV